MWRCSDIRQVHIDGPALRVLGPQRAGGGREAGGRVAGQSRQGGPGRGQCPGQEDHHQTRLPAATMCRVINQSEAVP